MEQIDPRKLKGGVKARWLRQNRQLVLDYVAKHGIGTAMLRFGINRPDTFEALVTGDARALPPNSFDVQMAIGTARQAIDSARLAHIEIRGLAQSYEQFIESLANQLRDKFLLPLLRHTFTLEGKPVLLENELALNEPLPRLPRAKTTKTMKCNRELKATYLSAHPFVGVKE